MDNLRIISEKVNTDIDPNGAPESILAQNHNDILQSFLRSSGKYVGLPYKAKTNFNGVMNNGELYFSNAFNVEQIVKVSAKTTDGTDTDPILKNYGSNDIFHIKDFAGRSVYFLILNVFEKYDDNFQLYYELLLSPFVSNINYSYQINEENICVLELIHSKIEKDFVNVKDFGAKGDAVWDGIKYNGTDDTQAFQDAIDTGKNVFIPKSKYLISSELIPQSNTRIFGVNKESILLFDNVENGTPATYFNIFNVVDKFNIFFENISFADGGHIGYQEFLSFSEACIAIRIFGSSTKNINVLNCDFSFIHGHGVYDGSEESFNNFIGNTGNGCGQNILNINSKFPTIHHNKGCNSGFGLLEASCGNGSIQFNEAYSNEKNGITIGGFAGLVSNGFGSNNLISNNKCYLNKNIGIHLSAHCVDTIVSNNIVYKNENIGISTHEPNDIVSNILITQNKIFDNGLDGESTKVGVYIDSKGCSVVNNEIYNTGVSGYSTHTGVAVNFEKHGQIIKHNNFNGITNWEISIQTNDLVDLEFNSDDRVELLGSVFIKDKLPKVGIGYVGQPIKNSEKYVWIDNATSPKTAILPDAEEYPEGEILRIVDEKGFAMTNNVTLVTVAGNKLNGVVDGTFVMNKNFQCLELINVKSSKTWIILNNQMGIE